MRDCTSYETQNTLRLADDLARQEDIAYRRKGSQEGDIAEKKAWNIRRQLQSERPSAAKYELLLATKETESLAKGLRNKWQNAIVRQDNHRVDCLQLLARNWREASSYWTIFATPTIDLNILPPYSFIIQFIFKLAQPYISRDEQDFYIIDNPVRKDKIFGLPYVASTSWKGSLRSAFWHLEHKEDDAVVLRLFGNKKNIQDSKLFLSGRLQFFPTFFTMRSLEIINPQDRKLRAGTDPIPFECVPVDSEGTFTLLYVPFDLVGEDENETRAQATRDLELVIEAVEAMFRKYGFGAKTSSGFGLAGEEVEGILSMKVKDGQPVEFTNFADFMKSPEKMAAQLMMKKEGESR